MDDTDLDELPSEHGIKNLKRLSIKKVPNLFTIPDPKKFEKLNRIDVTYSMHCCAFLKREIQTRTNYQYEYNGKSPCNSTMDEFMGANIDNPDFPVNETINNKTNANNDTCLLYTSPSPRDS